MKDITIYIFHNVCIFNVIFLTYNMNVGLFLHNRNWFIWHVLISKQNNMQYQGTHMTSLYGHYTVQCSLSGKKLCCRVMSMYLHWVFKYKDASLSHFVFKWHPQTVFFVKLLEIDVPGAELSHNNIHNHSVIQLKRWLGCRNLQVFGYKTTLVERYFEK